MARSNDELELLLRDRLDEIQARIAELAKAPEPGAGIGVGNSLLGTEEKLRRALAKLDEGSYGHCDSCGGPIAPGRLQVAPDSTLCIDCAHKGRSRLQNEPT